MNTAYQSLCARLMMAGVPDARFDAVQLYKFVTGRDPRLDNGPTPDEASSLRVLGERRAAREPLQYLLGEWDFMDFTLKVGRGVLCPRADSEVVCETAIELLKDSEAPVVYDLCAGTGCLGLGIGQLGIVIPCIQPIQRLAFGHLLSTGNILFHHCTGYLGSYRYLLQSHNGTCIFSHNWRI